MDTTPPFGARVCSLISQCPTNLSLYQLSRHASEPLLSRPWATATKLVKLSRATTNTLVPINLFMADLLESSLSVFEYFAFLRFCRINTTRRWLVAGIFPQLMERAFAGSGCVGCLVNQDNTREASIP